MGFPPRRGARAALTVAAAGLALSLAACGGDGGAAGVAPAADPGVPAAAAAPVAPAPSGPLTQGDVVTPGKRTPAAVRKALGSRPVVLAFVYGRSRDEVAVRKAVAKVRASSTGSGVAFFVYDVSTRGFGDVTTRVAVTETPSVVVIGADGRVANVWTGLVDAEMLTQSVSAAK